MHRHKALFLLTYLHIHIRGGKRMETVSAINSFINGIVWGPVMICTMLGVGIYYSLRLNFIQIRDIKLWWKCTAGSIFKKDKAGSSTRISPFQAMATSLAGAIGTGNIVGVAGAISLGGAGAVFWMWAAAFFGMATSYAETVLGVKYRQKQNGKYVGGPMYYIEKGLHCKWGGVCFAVICTAAALGMGNMTQSNSAAAALQYSFGIRPEISALLITAAAAAVIFGGIRRIAKVTEKLVPAMALIYILLAVIILTINAGRIPEAFIRIITSAFDIRSAAGGFSGCTMAMAVRYGISRGVFSNEAGLGSSPIVHAAADTDDPYREGMWGIFQVFIDTIVLCTLMALCILTSGADVTNTDAAELSSAAFGNTLGHIGEAALSLSVVLFAFATLVSWCYYGEKSLEYLSGGSLIPLYRMIYCLAAYFGCIMSVSLVWEISDTLNGLMAVPNLIALILLRNEISPPLPGCRLCWAAAQTCPGCSPGPRQGASSLDPCTSCNSRRRHAGGAKRSVTTIPNSTFHIPHLAKLHLSISKDRE